MSTGSKELVGGGRMKGGRWNIEVKVVGGGRLEVGRGAIDVKVVGGERVDYRCKR